MKTMGIVLIEEFMRKYPDTASWFKTFRELVQHAEWDKNIDFREIFGSASFVGDRRMVFNIKGNNYRMEVQISYKFEIVRIKRTGTHAKL